MDVDKPFDLNGEERYEDADVIFTPTHLGEVLKDEIESRKISQRKLAQQMGISYKVLNDLLNGRRSLTTPTAMMFEAALDVPADSLMRLQLKYNMQQATADAALMERGCIQQSPS